jgi:hypothetical protein
MKFFRAGNTYVEQDMGEKLKLKVEVPREIFRIGFAGELSRTGAQFTPS